MKYQSFNFSYKLKGAKVVKGGTMAAVYFFDQILDCLSAAFFQKWSSLDGRPERIASFKFL